MKELGTMRMVKEEPEIPATKTAVLSPPTFQPNYPSLAARLLKQSLVLLVVAALGFWSYHISQKYLLQAVEVIGESMSPTLSNSNWYLLNRLVYHFREPRVGDIVVLNDPQDQGFVIKRVVARPGDAVYVKAGHVYVNGKLLTEPYLPPHTPTFSSPDYTAQFWICGEGHYFVLGDNRNNSTDSRIYGTVPFQSILGAVMR